MLRALVESVELFTDLGNHPALADALEYLGVAYAAVEDEERATASWTEAIAIFDPCDPPRSEAIRARMNAQL